MLLRLLCKHISSIGTMRGILLRSETMLERRDLGTRLDINFYIMYDLLYKYYLPVQHVLLY